MLVLSRHAGDSIIIGDNISIRVLDVIGGRVVLGVDAPRDISVHRHEVYQRIIEERNHDHLE